MPRGHDAMQRAVRVLQIATRDSERPEADKPTLLSEMITGSLEEGVECRSRGPGGGSAPVTKKTMAGVEPATT